MTIRTNTTLNVILEPGLLCTMLRSQREVCYGNGYARRVESDCNSPIINETLKCRWGDHICPEPACWNLTRSKRAVKIFNIMVNYVATSLNMTFSALSDPTRRDILSRLTQGALTATELAAPFDISLPAISRHLKVLEKAGLLLRQREGRFHYFRLNAQPLEEAAGWITEYEQFWKGQLDALDTFLAAPTEGDEI